MGISLHGSLASLTAGKRQAERVLAQGVLHDTGRTVGGTDNVNGQLNVVRAQLGAEGVDAITKSVRAQGVQEYVAPRIGELFGIGHLFPATVLRNDAAIIAFVPGTTAKGAGVTSVATLDAALGAMYLRMGATRLEAGASATRDRQLLGTFDYALANDDRHPANLMVARSQVSAVDQGSIGNGEMPDALVPRLGKWYQGGEVDGRVRLDAAALEVVRSIEPQALLRELDGLAAARTGLARTDALLDGVASDTYRERVLQRLRHVQENGSYEWRSSIDTPSPEPRILEQRPAPLE